MSAHRRLAALMLALLGTPAAAASLTVGLSDSQIRVTAGFAGAHVLVYGAIDGGSDVIITVRGPPTPAVLRRKSRVAAIWLNADSYRYEAVPSFDLTLSNRPVEQILGASDRDRAEIGTDAIRLIAADRQDRTSSAQYRQALISTLKDQGLYAARPDAVTFDPDQRLFQAALNLPPTIPTGTYQIVVYLVQSGRIIARTTMDLDVAEAGAAAELDHLAHHRPRLYGLLAVLASGMAGLLGRSLFRPR